MIGRNARWEIENNNTIDLKTQTYVGKYSPVFEGLWAPVTQNFGSLGFHEPLVGGEGGCWGYKQGEEETFRGSEGAGGRQRPEDCPLGCAMNEACVTEEA